MLPRPVRSHTAIGVVSATAATDGIADGKPESGSSCTRIQVELLAAAPIPESYNTCPAICLWPISFDPGFNRECGGISERAEVDSLNIADVTVRARADGYRQVRIQRIIARLPLSGVEVLALVAAPE